MKSTTPPLAADLVSAQSLGIGLPGQINLDHRIDCDECRHRGQCQHAMDLRHRGKAKLVHSADCCIEGGIAQRHTGCHPAPELPGAEQRHQCFGHHARVVTEVAQPGPGKTRQDCTLELAQAKLNCIAGALRQLSFGDNGTGCRIRRFQPICRFHTPSARGSETLVSHCGLVIRCDLRPAVGGDTRIFGFKTRSDVKVMCKGFAR